MTTVATPRWRGASTPEELDLEAYFPLARKFAWRYADRLGSFDDAFQEAIIGLCEARDRWQPERGPFQAVVYRYLQSHFSGLVEKLDRQDGVPFRLRRSARYAAARGEARPLLPWEEVPVVVVSSNQLDDDGNELDIFEAIADRVCADA